MAENTFLGLQPYTEADAYRFKGRTEESQELFHLIVRNDFTVCYAESGEGKTSLLNAGVFPLLRQNMFFPIAITFTSDDYQRTPDSFDTIIDRCIKDSIADYNEKNKGINIEYKLCSTDFQDTDRQSALQQELSKYSWWKLRNYKPQAMGLTFTPVFVFDQFEEVFNLPGSIVWTKKFFDWLEDVSSDSCPDEIIQKVRSIIGEKAAFPTIKEEKDFKAVFSLRKEFIGELDYWGMQKCFIPSLKDNRYCLKALTYEGAKKVMTQQQSFEESKVDQVLRYFVQQYSREPEKTIAENLPVIPALLLSVVCDSWEKDLKYFSDIDANGIDDSLIKILEKFYDEAIDSVVNELIKRNPRSGSPDYIRADIEAAMFDLVDVNGKRVRTKAATTLATKMYIGEEIKISKYKKILSEHRIIKITQIDGEDYVEIVHDALCPIIAKRKESTLEEKLKKTEERKKQRIIIRLLVIMAITMGFFGVWYLGQREKVNAIVQKNELLLMQKDSIKKQAYQISLQRDSLGKQLQFIQIQTDSLNRQALFMILQNDSLNIQSQLIYRQKESIKKTIKELKTLQARHDSIKYALQIAKISAEETIRDRGLESAMIKMKGKLPAPVIGRYRVVKQFGKYEVESLALENKGITLSVESKAAIHSIYEGEVSAVFSFDGKIVVMIRHGSYISVYINLKKTDVKRGQQVKTGETIGLVNDDNLLDFQLRYETELENPELWLNMEDSY